MANSSIFELEEPLPFAVVAMRVAKVGNVDLSRLSSSWVEVTVDPFVPSTIGLASEAIRRPCWAAYVHLSFTFADSSMASTIDVKHQRVLLVKFRMASTEHGMLAALQGTTDEF